MANTKLNPDAIIDKSITKAKLATSLQTEIEGKVDNTENGLNGLINKLSTGTATPADADYFISQYSGGGTATTTYHRRPLSSLWTWIKGKVEALGYAKATDVNTKIAQVEKAAGGVKALGSIELKADDKAANKTALAAFLKILTDAGIDTANGYSTPIRITGNSQEYFGTLNIGTGTLLSGVVTDINESHHYPCNVNITDGELTFSETNYFLEKTSNEVVEMLDAIKYSHTPVPFTETTLSNKAQLEVFLSKVPDAQVMHCTYKGVYAGTLHKINGDWFGLLVKNTNDYADNLNVKLQADGTLIEGTTSVQSINEQLDAINGEVK